MLKSVKAPIVSGVRPPKTLETCTGPERVQIPGYGPNRPEPPDRRTGWSNAEEPQENSSSAFFGVEMGRAIFIS